MRVRTRQNWLRAATLVCLSLILAIGLGSVAFGNGVRPAPTNVTAEDTGRGGEVEVAWDAISGSETYRVAWSTVNGDPDDWGHYADPSVTQYTVDELDDGTVYYFAVRDGDNKNSDWSTPIAATPTSFLSLTIDPDGVGAIDDWGTKETTVTIEATNAASADIDRLWYQFQPADSKLVEGDWQSAPTTPTAELTAPEGHWTLYVRATSAGYTKNASAEFYTDWTAPEAAFELDPEEPNGDNGWYRSADLTLTAEDLPSSEATPVCSGVKSLWVNGDEKTGDSYEYDFAQGKNEIGLAATDVAGNTSDTASITVLFDDVAPTVDASGVDGYVAGEPSTSTVEVHLEGDDATSGFASLSHVFLPFGDEPSDETEWDVTESDEVTLTAPEGRYNLWYTGTDDAGNESELGSFETWSDFAAPVTSYATDPTKADGAKGTWLTPPAITFEAADTVDPSPKTYFRWDDGEIEEGTQTTASSVAGLHVLEYFSVDEAGWQEETKTAEFYVDPGQPVTKGYLSPDAPDGLNDYYTAKPEFSIEATASDEATIATIFYSVNDENPDEWETYAGPFTIDIEGDVTVYHYAIDVDDREGPVSSNHYKLDTQAPQIGASSPEYASSRFETVTVSVVDEVSGIDMVLMGRSIGEMAPVPFDPDTDLATYIPDMPWLVGENLIAIGATDKASNKSDVQFLLVCFDDQAPETTSDAVASYLSSASIKLSATDAGSGVASTHYQLDDGDVKSGTSVSTSVAGSHVLKFWSVDRAGNVEEANEVVFEVTKRTFTVDVVAGAGGSIAGPRTVTEGDEAVYTITPDAGYSVAQVVVNGSSVGAVSSYTLRNVTANHLITATFRLNPPVDPPVTRFTIAASAGAGGVITPAGSKVVTAGDDVEYQIKADAGFRIADVKVDGVSIGAVQAYTFSKVAADHTIAASFVADTYTVAISAGANGSASLSGEQTVTAGSNLTVSFTADAGYKVADVVVDGQSQGPLPTYTFTNIRANHVVAVTFAPKTYVITATAGGNGTITPSGDVTVAHGSNSAEFAFVPAPGHEVVDVEVNGVSMGRLDSYTFSSVTSDSTIHVTFGAKLLATKASLKLSAKSVKVKKYVTATGKLTGGTFPAGTKVRIEVRKAGATKYTVLRNVKLDSAGQVKYRFRASKKGIYFYRLRFMGNDQYLPSRLTNGTKLVVK